MSAYRALSKGKHVLLFPGGGREVCKRRGEEYSLLWKDEVDFVRTHRAGNMSLRLVSRGAVYAALE